MVSNQWHWVISPNRYSYILLLTSKILLLIHLYLSQLLACFFFLLILQIHTAVTRFSLSLAMWKLYFIVCLSWCVCGVLEIWEFILLVNSVGMLDTWCVIVLHFFPFCGKTIRYKKFFLYKEMLHFAYSIASISTFFRQLANFSPFF